jgi:glycosyltransferase involved in cell wall biosynthesis
MDKIRVAIMLPGKPIGGVGTIIKKLTVGVRLEGFDVELLVLSEKLLKTLASDISNINRLKMFDAVIYGGSLPLPSSLLIREYARTILFIHGYVRHERTFAIKHGGLNKKLSALARSILWQTSLTSHRIDKFMCICKTACEMSGIRENYILLPEFILPGEERCYERLSKESRKNSHENEDAVKILTYTSFARSPRLLSGQYVEHLMKMISRQVNKKVEVIIINPQLKTEALKPIGSITIRYIKPLPRVEFLRLLANSDLFIELNIDEELRDSTVEAALLGIPVAKLTHPLFKERCDYKEDDLIQAYSFKELANKISEYIQNIEFYYNTCSKALRDFILKFRTWNNVKRQLVEYLKEV